MSAATEEVIEMCSVRVGGTLFGVPIMRILEILGTPATQPMPLAPSYIGGLVHYRGEILTTVSLRSLLGMPAHSKPPDMLVFEGADGYFGLLVDAVGEVITVFEQSSNVLDASRDYLFESRLQPLLDSTGLKTLDCLAAALGRQLGNAMKESVAAAMTIKETSFFRDRKPFDLMQSDLLPPLIRQCDSVRRLRLWSAACSSGQEAYSLAMLLREHFPQLNNWQVEIMGTDISLDVVNRAQAGRYRRRGEPRTARALPAKIHARR